MKLAILTTQTTHHSYFVKRIKKFFSIDVVILETKSVVPKFDTDHKFEKERIDYEKKLFFNGEDVLIPDLTRTIQVENINEKNSVETLKEILPDVIIVFGTRKLSKEIIDICHDGIINLHGGDPLEYRGLDTHLWAIYHEDFSNIKVTLHKVNISLDDGDIVETKKVPIQTGMKIYQLRSSNAEVCVDLTLKALKEYRQKKQISSYPQIKKGRHYSFMPSELKKICVDKFHKYTETL